MLTVLSMLGGRTIGKYLAIAGAVAAVAFGMWLAAQSYNNAIAGKARAEAASAAKDLKIKQANGETEKANDSIRRLKQISDSQRRQVEQAMQLSRARAKRANDTSVTLTRILNTAGSPAVTEFERMLVEQLERGQGYKFDSTSSSSTARTASVSEAFLPFACFDKATARVMIHNAIVTADYIEDVEATKAGDNIGN